VNISQVCEPLRSPKLGKQNVCSGIILTVRLPNDAAQIFLVDMNQGLECPKP
jgi:hypothetical protein